MDDFFGIAITRSHASEKYRLSQNAADNETVMETTFRAQIKPWLIVQSNIERIFNPGLMPQVKPATVIGMHCEIAL